jgi:aminoglycoside phosphotransferase (APT) family kinase protein
METLGTGGEHHTVAVGDDLVYRFPKDPATAAKTEREIAVLASLAPALPLPVPAVRYVGRPSARFPYVFTGQQRIRGVEEA